MDKDYFDRIEKMMRSGNAAHVYLYKNQRRAEYWVDGTPEAIAGFLGNHPEADEIIITDTLDQIILNTFGNLIDRCCDASLLEDITKILIPIQMGKAKAPAIFAPTLEEVERFYNQTASFDMQML